MKKLLSCDTSDDCETDVEQIGQVLIAHVPILVTHWDRYGSKSVLALHLALNWVATFSKTKNFNQKVNV